MHQQVMAEGKMKIVPISLKEANAFIKKLHRHHTEVQGHKFSIGCEVGGYFTEYA